MNGRELRCVQAGCIKIFAEKVSGASAANRKELARALKSLAPGDAPELFREDLHQAVGAFVRAWEAKRLLIGA